MVMYSVAQCETLKPMNLTLMLQSFAECLIEKQPEQIQKPKKKKVKSCLRVLKFCPPWTLFYRLNVTCSTTNTQA